MAVIERRKHVFRYRMLQKGEVVAQFVTKADLEKALATPDPAMRTDSRALLAIVEAQPDYDGRSPTELGSPTTRGPGSSPPRPGLLSRLSSGSPARTNSSIMQDPGSDPPSPQVSRGEIPPALAPLSPRPKGLHNLLSPSGHHSPPKPQDEPKPAAQKRRVSFSAAPLQVAPDMTREPTQDVTGLQLEKPEETPAIAEALAAKAHLTAPDRAARRASLLRPPDADQMPVGPPENVLGWFYDDETQTWSCRDLTVRIAKEHFAEGAMRLAFKMLLEEDGTEKEIVAKQFGPTTEKEIFTPKKDTPGGDKILMKSGMLKLLKQNPGTEFEVTMVERIIRDDCQMSKVDFMMWYKRLYMYKGDVIMQEFCRTFAKAYNARNPPKEVRFLPAFLIVCNDRPEQAFYFCEPMITGHFEKYNNNSGQVETNNERNTPQAFSHFSYEHSDQKHIIVDIQGVGDTYTDPQIHSKERYFGMGNLEAEGIEAFFKTHECNSICMGLGLHNHGTKKKKKHLGTVYRRDDSPALGEGDA